MNTDKLRELWKRYPGGEGDAGTYSEKEILQMIKQRTELSLKRLNRSIYLETVAIFLALLIIVLYVFPAGNVFFFRGVQSFIILLIVFYFIFIGWLYQQINSISVVVNKLRQSLERKITLVSRFIRIYLWMNMIIAIIIFPLAIFSGYYAGLTEAHEAVLKLNFSDPTFIKLSAASVVLIIAFYPFLKWYLSRLYGRHVRDLTKCLEELTQVDEP
ncbi:MAG: hypothetical protein DDT42_01637 [candidate division WS2 bacterium]|uniref:Uncharacterized protein n=1 Tax=Psychracetigena formicireducens TaxID=2986056 RepID=A0A9E2BHN1_PSYF1|nr:hypothetical protein [Candidatus Psychracetigena formicireducens]